MQNLWHQPWRNTYVQGDAWSWIGSIGLGIAVGVAYLLAAHLSLILLTKPDCVAVFWPAAGIASGTLIALGSKARMPVTLGVLTASAAASLLGGRNFPATIVFALCNAGEALLVAWLIQQRFGMDFRLDSLRNVLAFFAAAGVGPAISAIVATAGFVLFYNSGAPVPTTWLNWFASDALGIIMVAPLLIGLGGLRRDLPERWELAEGTLTLAALAAVSAIAFGSPAHYWWYTPSFRSVYPCLRCWLRIAGRYLLLLPHLFSVAPWSGQPPSASGSWARSRACPIARLLRERRCWPSRPIRWFSPLCSPSGGTMRLRSRTPTIDSRAAIIGFSWLSTVPSSVSGALTQRPAALKATRGTGKFMVVGPTPRPKPLQKHGLSSIPATYQHWTPPSLPARRTGGRCKVEYRLAPILGGADLRQERWVALEGTVVCDANGRPDQLLGVTRDITHHKQAERALAERNLQLALAGKFALVGTYAYDVGSERYQVSPGYAVMHGLAEETEETSRAEWRSRVHPDDLAGVEAGFHQAMAERRRDYHCEYRIVRSGDEIRWIDSRSFISYDRDGRRAAPRRCEHRRYAAEGNGSCAQGAPSHSGGRFGGRPCDGLRMGRHHMPIAAQRQCGSHSWR